MENNFHTRLEIVFKKIFKKKVIFSPELERENSSSWTSLKHVELIVAIENEFSVRFDGADATEMANVSNIIDLLKKKCT